LFLQTFLYFIFFFFFFNSISPKPFWPNYSLVPQFERAKSTDFAVSKGNSKYNDPNRSPYAAFNCTRGKSYQALGKNQAKGARGTINKEIILANRVEAAARSDFCVHIGKKCSSK
jgi:hypothetical protein